MVAVQSRPATEITSSDEKAIYEVLFDRGALTPIQVASAVGVEVSVVDGWLASKAAGRVIDFDPRFGRYATFE